MMEQGIIDSLEETVKSKREELRLEKEKMVSKVLSHVAGLTNDEKFVEIQKELGREIHFVSEEIILGVKRFGGIIIDRMMSKELCPASELGICIKGFSNLQTKEKCPFCEGHGTAEWDRDNS